MNTQEGNKHRGGMINKSTKTSPFLVLPVGDAGNEANLRIPDPLGPVLKPVSTEPTEEYRDRQIIGRERHYVPTPLEECAQLGEGNDGGRSRQTPRWTGAQSVDCEDGYTHPGVLYSGVDLVVPVCKRLEVLSVSTASVEIMEKARTVEEARRGKRLCRRGAKLSVPMILARR